MTAEHWFALITDYWTELSCCRVSAEPLRDVGTWKVDRLLSQIYVWLTAHAAEEIGWRSNALDQRISQAMNDVRLAAMQRTIGFHVLVLVAHGMHIAQTVTSKIFTLSSRLG